MTWLNTRVARLETALTVGAHTGTRARQIRILVTEREWAAVPLDSLIHVRGKVYRYVGEYDPVASTFQAEEVDLPYDRSWGLQPVDYVVMAI